MKVCKSIFIFVLIGCSFIYAYAARTPVKEEAVRERARILKGLVTTAYYGFPSTWESDLFVQNIKVIKRHLQVHFQTCFLDNEEVESVCNSQPNTQAKQSCINKTQNHSDRVHLEDLIREMIRMSDEDLQLYFKDLRCDYIMEDLANGYFTQIRRQVWNIIFNLSEEGQISKERRDILLAYLDEFYGSPEAPSVQEERERLISQFQICEYSSGIIDQTLNWIDNFIGNTVTECEDIIKTAQEKGITYLDVQEAVEVSLAFWSISNEG